MWDRAWVLAGFALSICLTGTAEAQRVVETGWLEWRGPQQDGTSTETGLPDRWEAGGDHDLWSIDLPGRGTPVIARYTDGDRLFVVGYRGEEAELKEVLVCVDPKSGEMLWERGFADFISDIIYNRYAIGAPSVDPETGNVYLHTSPGLVVCFDRDGGELWRVSMMEEYGRITFPNGRTGSPILEGDLVIINAITSNWGREGPARNRFYAFDKNTGRLVWSSTPGVGPPYLKDSSFSTPIFEMRDGRRMFYAGTGCGNIVAVNALNGRPLWRYQFALGGVNSSPVIYRRPAGDLLIEVHGKENVGDTGRGQMVAIKLDDAMKAAADADASPAVLDDSVVAWRNDDVSMFTSSPTLVGDRVYQCTIDGRLVCIDADTGKTLWVKKLGVDQLHASPVYADGKLYVPMWHDGLVILKPGDDGAEILQRIELDGLCIGSPAVWNGTVFVHTTKKLYAIGTGSDGDPPASWPEPGRNGGEAGDLAALRALPAEVLLRPGESVSFEVEGVSATGRPVTDDVAATWSSFVPPNARVKSRMDASFRDGQLTASDESAPSAGAFKAEAGDVSGTIRGRVLPSPPYEEDFGSIELTETNRAGQAFAYPPLPWIGARLKWEIREDPTDPGNQVLAKTLDRVLFQRSMIFTGHPDDRDYTVQADIMSDGNRRMMSAGGVIVQRYIVALIGNAQVLEVSSNHERLKVSVPFRWKPKTWYTLKATVEAHDDGSGVVKAKAWERGQPEPGSWTIEVQTPNIHREGSPGLFGFSPQSRLPVYIDNVKVTPNE